jgi:hypothetical protein
MKEPGLCRAFLILRPQLSPPCHFEGGTTEKSSASYSIGAKVNKHSYFYLNDTCQN